MSDIPGTNIGAVFGAHDEKTLIQLHDVASRAERVALMSDGHVGYVMPIGGVAAYDNQVSVVGVGFDIACLAAGTPVTTVDGHHRLIETVGAADRIACWDGSSTRVVDPNLGAVVRGHRDVCRLTLANGRAVRCTADHEIRTPEGWRRADSLQVGDRVACVPHIGLPFVPPAGSLAPRVTDFAADWLGARGLYPLDSASPSFPVVVRLLGYVSGDGHLSSDGKRISLYTTDARDAEQVATDWTRLDARPRVYRRQRALHHLPEHHVAVDSTALHALFAALGSPVGRKHWAPEPMPWLFAAPPWVRAHFLSAFASAEMTTPRVHANGVVPNLALKQAGGDRHAIDFLAALLRSLDFDVSIVRSGPDTGDRTVHVLQILGGVAAQLRFIEEIGFCYAAVKREAAAIVASTAWAGLGERRTRDAAKAEARALHAAGVGWRAVIDDVTRRFDVPGGFVYHSIYDSRGASRRLPGTVSPDVSGEACWVPVAATAPDGTADVFDVVTNDPAHAFLATGVVVHNCGNAAIRTDRTLADYSADDWPRIADEIQRTVSFGIGRSNRADDAPVDHPLFASPAWGALPDAVDLSELHRKARAQLGTVGSGNHYVDVFADEAGAVWVGVHFGSRGLGHTIASGFLALSQGAAWGARVPEREALLDLATPLGDGYWALMQLAGEYAYAGREWVARKVVHLLGGQELELVHNHHNFAWKEMHDGRPLVVVRKGATPAFPGQKGFVGGSMGDQSVILAGSDSDSDVQRAALYSTVHGAGRVMSRTAARGKVKGWGKKARIVEPGRISAEMMRDWLAPLGVILRGGGLDEAPQAYRRLPDVIAAQGGTVSVLHTLTPRIVVMAGADEFDPYKD